MFYRASRSSLSRNNHSLSRVINLIQQEFPLPKGNIKETVYKQIMFLKSAFSELAEAIVSELDSFKEEFRSEIKRNREELYIKIDEFSNLNRAAEETHHQLNSALTQTTKQALSQLQGLNESHAIFTKRLEVLTFETEKLTQEFNSKDQQTEHTLNSMQSQLNSSLQAPKFQSSETPSPPPDFHYKLTYLEQLIQTQRRELFSCLTLTEQRLLKQLHQLNLKQ